MTTREYKPTTLDIIPEGCEVTKAEVDPHGLDAHAPGAKLDSGKNRLALVLLDFNKALLEVGKVGTFGANKYSPHGWKSVPDGIERYTDALFRHEFAEPDDSIDAESGMLHAAQIAWNALARLQLILEAKEADNQTSDIPF